jgi:hypothetical protein
MRGFRSSATACGPSRSSSKSRNFERGRARATGLVPVADLPRRQLCRSFDEEPLPVADRAFQRLLDLIAGLDFRASAEHRLADLNRVAACDLLH